MNYHINYHKEAIKELDKLHGTISRRIILAIEKFAEGTNHCDVKKIKASEHYRLRVGDYRIIFLIEDQSINILKIGHRKNIYNKI